MYERYIHTLNFINVEFPIKITDVPKFMKQNKNISINFKGRNNSRHPLYASDELHGNHTNLLLISDSQKSHYIRIKDFERIVYNNRKHGGKNYVLYRCLQLHSVKFEFHMKEC